MILDRLADLKDLAERASATGATLTKGASFADVERQIAGARLTFANVGVARSRSLDLLAPAERRRVFEAASRLKQALDGLNEATDEKLAAIACSTADRGSLRAVTIHAAGLLTELRSAQQALLQRVADRVWKEDDRERFDLLSHLADHPTAAEGTLLIEDVHDRLIERLANPDRTLCGTELDSLLDDSADAERAAQELRAEPIDPEVLHFWRASTSEEGAPLTGLTNVVRDWLQEHEALNSFRIHRDS